MEKIKGWEEVKASGEFERLPNGAYLCTIINVEDKADSQYLNIEFDICDGEYLQFATEAYKNLNFWVLSTIRSYKDTAQGMFKQFINAVEASNDDFKWDWDEKKLEGLDVGFVICTEHYLKNNGDEGMRYKVHRAFPVSEFDKYAAKTYDDLLADELKGIKQEKATETAKNPFAKK